MEKVRINFKMAKPLSNDLDLIADELGITKTSFIQMAVMEKLMRINNEKPKSLNTSQTMSKTIHK